MKQREITPNFFKYPNKEVKKKGFREAPYQGKGSHLAQYKKSNGTKILIIIPKRDPIPIGTLLSIMKQARMEREEFVDFLDK
ncbi:type II toxin-antitoxin system HicA family toxin [Methanospirillum sp. J.3.6.1-F.2.7.3]|uniref:Type II toxin-antitoxin system HicA family toxin n=1 Tax=Methanospirillum purgamenti TaxID=2834276 RepID=A0A8E7B3Z9_9EURY|nr:MULTISPECIES: type II toxin-antitoxin system HicA family toxin [Methanospirillum]MDX8550786.1 type II toxin-antitoxin system HicA family toxin [Methanospirillum hungatei]QVV89976.1 type II toxin-antitoxin system HicA family toxin [Methanospirillum sp. J.3.6.1-F.2.7.3]